MGSPWLNGWVTRWSDLQIQPLLLIKCHWAIDSLIVLINEVMLFRPGKFWLNWWLVTQSSYYPACESSQFYSFQEFQKACFSDSPETRPCFLKSLLITFTNHSAPSSLPFQNSAFQGFYWNPPFSQNTRTEIHCVNKQSKYMLWMSFPKSPGVCPRSSCPGRPSSSTEEQFPKEVRELRNRLWLRLCSVGSRSVCLICFSSTVADGDSQSVFATDGRKT